MRSHILPVLQVVLMPITCSITYGWSVYLGHVEAGFPYISDTGTYPPESCLFGVLLALYAFVTAVTVTLRWQQVRTFYQADASRGVIRANNVGLFLGLAGAMGVLLVANFQETNVLIVHMVGATMAFGGSAVYAWLQTWMSYKAVLLPGHHACLRHFRAALSLLITVCFALGLHGAHSLDVARVGDGFPQRRLLRDLLPRVPTLLLHLPGGLPLHGHRVPAARGLGVGRTQ